MQVVRNKRGQFIIIAVLLIAIMMVSLMVIMYSTVTYYKHERWEEYLAIIDNVKISSNHVVEMSLANYTNYTLTMNNTILRDNLNQWQSDLRKAYPGFGVILTCSLANKIHDAYGVKIGYENGLYQEWDEDKSFSAANATINVNITSVGLTGYKFIAQAFLRVKILDATWNSPDSDVVILLAVDKEGPMPVTDLEKNSFSIGFSPEPEPFNVTLTHYYDANHRSIIYEIGCNNISQQPSSVEVTVVDSRSIKVIANSTVTSG